MTTRPSPHCSDHRPAQIRQPSRSELASPFIHVQTVEPGGLRSAHRRLRAVLAANLVEWVNAACLSIMLPEYATVYAQGGLSHCHFRVADTGRAADTRHTGQHRHSRPLPTLNVRTALPAAASDRGTEPAHTHERNTDADRLPGSSAGQHATCNSAFDTRQRCWRACPSRLEERLSGGVMLSIAVSWRTLSID